MLLKSSMVERVGRFGNALVRRAFALLGIHTVLMFICPPPVLLPIGIALWVLTASACVAKFARGPHRLSLVASFSFFLILGTEIFLTYDSAMRFRW